MKARKNKRSMAAILFLAAILGTSASAFTAGVTFPGAGAGAAGDGNESISGYTVSDIHYSVDALDEDNIGGVTFTLDSPAEDVQATLNGGALQACAATNLAETDFSCDLSSLGESIVAAVDLRVVALG
jgi:hypothetical protein